MTSEDGGHLYPGDIVLVPLGDEAFKLQVALLLSVQEDEATALVVWSCGGSAVLHVYVVDSVLCLAKGTEKGRIKVRYRSQRW